MEILLYSFAVVSKVLDICMGEYMKLWYIFIFTPSHVPYYLSQECSANIVFQCIFLLF
jgi:hypothetical protein